MASKSPNNAGRTPTTVSADAKLRVYMGDLVHTWEKTSTWMMPLNIGLVGSYAKKELGSALELRLFKDPFALIEAIKAAPPDVVALGHYVWNVNLNRRVFDFAKSVSPDILTVGGGPMITVYNANEKSVRRLIAHYKYKSVDAWVLDQGELGFAEVLRAFLKFEKRVSDFHRQAIPGCITFAGGPEGEIHIGPKLDTIEGLDDIPSPYLTGLMDPFFEMGLTPMIETNRSCPYRCTFCAFGIGGAKLTRYSDERVRSEIEYIAARSPKSASLFITDANFSILPRDIEIARHIYETSVSTNWPRQVHCYWNKARPDRVAAVAKEFRGLAPIGASVQSLNANTLDAIKRKNLPLDKILEMFNDLKQFDRGLHFYSELIAGLPQERFGDHIEANRILVDLGAEVQNYNLHLIPGTEMETEEGRADFVRKTAWRLHDNAFGVYEGEPVFEGQEVVVETTTMSNKEILSLRFIHFIFQFMWGKRWYFDFLTYFKNLGVNPIDMMVRVAEACARATGGIGRIYQAFGADHALESFDTADGLYAYWSKPDNLERLRKGEYGKLNFQYSFLIDLEHRSEFNDLLLGVGNQAIDEGFPEDAAALRDQCAEVLRLGAERRVTFGERMEIAEHKTIRSKYDLAEWVARERAGTPRPVENGSGMEFELFLSPDQVDTIRKMLLQFRSHNRNLTLRKMTEYANPNVFFYNIRQNQDQREFRTSSHDAAMGAAI